MNDILSQLMAKHQLIKRHYTRFDMMSLQITDEDIENMYKDGYSGTWTRTQKLAGDGLGMAVVQKLLKLNNAEINILRNQSAGKNKMVGGLPCENNIFEIVFRR